MFITLFFYVIKKTRTDIKINNKFERHLLNIINTIQNLQIILIYKKKTRKSALNILAFVMLDHIFCIAIKLTIIFLVQP